MLYSLPLRAPSRQPQEGPGRAPERTPGRIPDQTPNRKPRRRAFGRKISRKKIYRRRRRAALAIILVFMLAVAWMLWRSGEDATTAGPAPIPQSEVRKSETRQSEAPAKSGTATAEPARAAGDPDVWGSKKKDAEQKLPPPPADKTLYLTVPKMGRYDDVVRNDDSEWALDNGAIKLPTSGFPWQPSANVYIAGHVLGYAGTGSYMQFANLPSMVKGDEIFLTDANGTTYEYRVTEILTVRPDENWVTAPVAGKDLVSLQTCINPPNYDHRLIVRGERVGVKTTA
ncbi:MAG TPA: class E sortase [Rubrobacteraceae bacterium]|nr:class E sortase [Rubrobacteraceae bacterium]